jgi:uncharacterized protein
LLLRSPDFQPRSARSRPPWLVQSHRVLVERLLDPGQGGYPCHFGVRGERDGHNWFTMLDEGADGPHAVADLAETLCAFRELAWRGPKRQSLIAFVGPPAPTPGLAQDTARFWRLLAQLSAHDEAPWPADRPTDVQDPAWQWCFAGEPWFVFGCSPAYQARRSRNLGPCLTLVFQVRRVFEGISGSSKAGRAAKRQVRDQLGRYDQIPPHPHLGDAEHSSVFKWRQYLLPDDQQPLDPDACPFTPPARVVAVEQAGGVGS